MQRYGMTIPFDGVPLHAQREWVIELEELGDVDPVTGELRDAPSDDGFAVPYDDAASAEGASAGVPADSAA